MKPNPQPEWLRELTYGMAGGTKYRLLIDGENFAVVQMPGERWGDNSGTHYGKTTYHLIDKHTDPRGGHGIMDGRTLKDGGRIGAKTKREWEVLVRISDKIGTYADEDTVALFLEHFVDNLTAYLQFQWRESKDMATGKKDPHGCSADYWNGHCNMIRVTLAKLKELVPGLMRDA